MNKINKFNEQFDTVLVIGNGFALSLGLKTSYNHFIASEQFESLITEKNHLAIYLKEQKNLKNWIDIENELKEYSNSNEHLKSNFKAEFVNLKSSLKKYLKNEIGTSHKSRTSSELMVQAVLGEELKGNKVLILNFNYTYEFRTLIFYTKTKSIDINFYEEIHVHGNLNSDIIFGVEKNANINPNHTFLKKCANDNFIPNDISSLLMQSQNIIFFGHSIGKTDHPYFRDFFEATSNKNNSSVNYKAKNIIIYHYGDSDKDRILTQVDLLTNNNIDLIKMHNNFALIDSSNPGNSYVELCDILSEEEVLL